MVVIRALALLLFCSSALACTSYETLRAGRIADYAAAAQSGGVWIVGDSHVERLSTAYAQDVQTINGAPVYFAGIAGATWQTLRDCIPWTAIAAKVPARIYMMAGVNDANNNICCNVYGDLTYAYVMVMMQAIEQARQIAGSVTLVSDPPPEYAAGINAYRVHAMARAAYYLSTLDWSIFYWPTNPGPFAFVDLYGLMGAGGNPASLIYSGPRYAAAGSTLDTVHFPHEVCATILGNLQ